MSETDKTRDAGESDEWLDRAFMALADPVRRQIVARLSLSDATVNELAAPFGISKQAVSKHIQVLEHAELITRSRDAQRRPCHLDPAGLERLTEWIDTYRLATEERFRRLDALLGARVAPATTPQRPSATAKAEPHNENGMRS